MVGGAHDHGQGQQRVQQPQPPPPGTGGDDEPDRHHQGPAEVQRRHRRELVGQVVALRRPVHRGAVHARGVDQARPGEHPRRGERERQVQHQRRGGDRGQDPAGPDVVGRAAQVEPDQEGRRGREVDQGVVGVRAVHQRVAVQQERLQRTLAGQVEPSFGVPHVMGVAVRLAGVPGREPAAGLVDEEEPRDQQELSDYGRPRCRVGLRCGRLGAGIHPPAPSLTWCVWWCVWWCVRWCRIIDTRSYRYASVPIRSGTGTLAYRLMCATLEARTTTGATAAGRDRTSSEETDR